MRKNTVKYLLPWQMQDNIVLGIDDTHEWQSTSSYIRRALGVDYVDEGFCEVRVYRIGATWTHTYSPVDEGEITAEKAMENADKYLIAMGYYLIPEDQVERFKTKLTTLL